MRKSGVSEKHNKGFVVVGGSKCGTTAIYFYLKNHPDICLTKIKETFFFGKRKPSRIKNNLMSEDYSSLFSDCSGKSIRGEVSGAYLNTYSASKIKEKLGNTRIIVVLRNPVERIFSMYRYKCSLRQYSGDIKSFMGIIKSLDFYTPAISEYFRLFGKENVLILRFEDLIADSKAFFTEFYEFIGIRKLFFEFEVVNRTMLFKSPLLLRIYTSFFNKLSLGTYMMCMKKSPKKALLLFYGKYLNGSLFHRRLFDFLEKKSLNIRLSDEEKEYLSEIYRDDIIQLNKLLERKVY